MEDPHVTRQLTALAALLAVACGGPEIITKRGSVPLPKQPTWAWGARDTVSRYELDPVAQNPVLHQRVVQAIDSTFRREGWKRVDDPSQAQVIVTYHIGIKRTTQLQTTSTSSGSYYGGYRWGYYGAPTFVTSTTQEVEYNEGALMVVVRDRATGKVAWEGVYKKRIEDTIKVTPENIQRGVDQLLAELK